jgi:two-component system sensor histidine kinase/response regulator
MSRSARFGVTAEIAAAITSSLDIDEVLANVACRVAEALKVWECDIYGYTRGEETATCLALWAHTSDAGDAEWIGGSILLADQPTFARVLSEGRMLTAYLDDRGLPDADRERMEAWGEHATLLVPLISKDEVIGCLQLIEKRHRRVFSARDRELAATLSALAAAAIANARLFAGLTESERQYRSVLESMDDAFYRTDIDGNLVMASPSLPRLLGYDSLEQVIGLSVAREFYVDPSQREVMLERLEKDGSVVDFEVELRGHDGRAIRGSVTSHFYVDASGARQGVEGVVHDITERKQVEDALRLTQLSVDRAADMIHWIAPDGRLLYVSDSNCRRHGFSRDEMLAMTVFDLDPSMTGDIWRTHWQDLKEHGSVTFETTHRTKNGSIFPLEVTTNFVEHNGREYNFAFARDITERKRAERAVAEAEERSRLLLQSAGDGIFGLDHEGHVTFMNAAAEELLGWTAPELQGAAMHEAIHYARADGSPYPVEECPQHAAYTEGVESRVDDEVLWRRDGTCFAVEYMVRPLRKGDAVMGAIVTFRDISDRRAAEEALSQAKAQTEAANGDLELAVARANQLSMEAESANAAKSEFLANMSHEIRTPMNGVIGMTTLLLDTDLDAEQRDYTLTVQSSAEALLTIINDILDFSKIEAGKLEIETLDFDLRNAVEDTCDLPALNAGSKGLELTALVGADVPAALRGDPGRLRQVLTNLLGNAIKFTEHGEVAVAVGLVSETDGEAVLRFEVRDSGIGIPTDKLDQLFEAFTQADASTTRKYGGTGLGLTICRRLVELMGGEIGVQSEPGVGSTFWFTARFARQDPAVFAAEQDAGGLVDVAGVRVLAVDDNATNRKVVAGMLDAWRCRHTEVDGAQAALEALRAACSAGDPFRVVILDMMMPVMDGEALGALIKQDPELAASDLIMMTSMGGRGDAGRLEALGFSAYLTKPVKQSQLFDCLMAVLNRRGRLESQAAPRIITRHALAERDKRKIRILLAEDNAINRKVALKTLEKMGYRADAATNGAEALDALVQVRYDVVLMDVQMPEVDGMEATRRIRDPRSAVLDHAVPIVALTAHAMAEDRDACLAAGMDAYLSKPIEPDKLAAVLTRWTARRTAPEQAVGQTRTLTQDDPAVPAPSAGASSWGEAEPAGPPVFDESVLLNLLGGDREAAAEITAEYLADAPRQVAELLAAVVAGDGPLVCRKAHTLKGASANVGAEALRAVAYKMELAAADDALQDGEPLQTELGLQLSRLVSVLTGQGQEP